MKNKNSWIKHVENFRTKHHNLSWKQCLKKSKSTYHKNNIVGGGTVIRLSKLLYEPKDWSSLDNMDYNEFIIWFIIYRYIFNEDNPEYYIVHDIDYEYVEKYYHMPYQIWYYFEDKDAGTKWLEYTNNILWDKTFYRKKILTEIKSHKKNKSNFYVNLNKIKGVKSENDFRDYKKIIQNLINDIKDYNLYIPISFINIDFRILLKIFSDNSKLLFIPNPHSSRFYKSDRIRFYKFIEKFVEALKNKVEEEDKVEEDDESREKNPFNISCEIINNIIVSQIININKFFRGRSNHWRRL